MDRERRSTLRADFQQYYGLDLYSFFGEAEVDLSRLCDLTFHLPKESRTVVDGGLTQSEHLLCDLIDLLNRVSTLEACVAAANQVKLQKVRFPKPIRRPLSKSELAEEEARKAQEFVAGKRMLKSFNDPHKTEKILRRQKLSQEKEAKND